MQAATVGARIAEASGKSSFRASQRKIADSEAMVDRRQVLCVLGGTSAGTPVLIEAIGRAQQAGLLPALTVRLFGRDADRLRGVVAHAAFRLARLDGERARPPLELEAPAGIAQALAGADLVLSQVRPGGMAGRAADEALALAAGLPGDEGLGPSGLSCFLRGLPVMDCLHDAIARHAASAVCLQMTSPLGLTVARARRDHGLRCFGVCELPAATAARLAAAAGRILGIEGLSALHSGLNHQGWLHAFVDGAGVDRTADIVELAETAAVVGIDSGVIRRERAVPLPYLRLFYHTARVVAEQRRSGETRGAQLEKWGRRAAAEYARPGAPDHAALDAILAERSMHWYPEGVIPALAAFLGDAALTIPLDLPNGDAIAGVPAAAIVELPCRVAAGDIEPLRVPPLPPGPRRLLRQLVAYESAALSLAERPAADDLAAVLARHPLVRDGATAARLAHAIPRLQAGEDRLASTA
jgi:6-phospho-beta-glucosidase